MVFIRLVRHTDLWTLNKTATYEFTADFVNEIRKPKRGGKP